MSLVTIPFCRHQCKAKRSFSSSWFTATSWNARASASFVGTSSSPFRAAMYRSTLECKPLNENASFPGCPLGSGGVISGNRWSSTFRQNCSNAAPGPNFPQGIFSILDTLSNTFPIDSSGVVAKVWNDVRDRASKRRVCPPDINRVRKGKVMSGVVRNGVSAWAC